MRQTFVLFVSLGSMLLACSKSGEEPQPNTPSPGGPGSSIVFSKGQVAIAGRSGYDLDGGKRLDDGAAPSDFYWNVEATPNLRADLYAHNGAKFTITTLDKALVDNPSEALYTALTKQTYTDNPIATDSSIPIRVGTMIAFRTNDGRYGAFRVDKLETNLTITITWATFVN